MRRFISRSLVWRCPSAGTVVLEGIQQEGGALLHHVHLHEHVHNLSGGGRREGGGERKREGKERKGRGRGGERGEGKQEEDT